MTVFLIRRLMQAVVVHVRDVAGVHRRLCDRQSDRHPDQPEADQMERERAIRALGLDLPMWEQYLVFLQKAVTGDLGRSFAFSTPALQLIVERMPATLELAVAAMGISIVIGIPLGMWAGWRPESFGGRAIMAGSILGFSLPTFWVGLMLIMVFAVHLGWLPSTGRGETVEVLGIRFSIFTLNGWMHLLLPAFNLALFKALVIRLTRAGMREACCRTTSSSRAPRACPPAA
jgi:peptide/nickel transport system permease protein